MTTVTLAWLQRGRARAGAECVRRGLLPVCQRGASTGPRPRGRGMCCQILKTTMLCKASTGPRPRGRGMVFCNDKCSIKPRASTGPRPRGRGMSYRQKLAVKTRLRFNGAAPARARNVGGGCVRMFTLAGASTGPRPRGRGMFCNLHRDCSTDCLQRGRARAGAECWIYDYTAGTWSSLFNGAAPARARNEDSDERPLPFA